MRNFSPTLVYSSFLPIAKVENGAEESVCADPAAPVRTQVLVVVGAAEIWRNCVLRYRGAQNDVYKVA